jgi:hypothetical protein
LQIIRTSCGVAKSGQMAISSEVITGAGAGGERVGVGVGALEGVRDDERAWRGTMGADVRLWEWEWEYEWGGRECG